jgi:hypothetical protein
MSTKASLCNQQQTTYSGFGAMDDSEEINVGSKLWLRHVQWTGF